MDEQITNSQLDTFYNLQKQGKIDKTLEPRSLTKAKAWDYIQNAINGKEEVEEVVKPQSNEQNTNTLRTKVSNDQLARTYSNFFATIYNKDKTMKSILKRTDEVFKHFKEMV